MNLPNIELNDLRDIIRSRKSEVYVKKKTKKKENSF